MDGGGGGGGGGHGYRSEGSGVDSVGGEGCLSTYTRLRGWLTYQGLGPPILTPAGPMHVQGGQVAQLQR